MQLELVIPLIKIGNTNEQKVLAGVKHQQMVILAAIQLSVFPHTH